MGNTLSLVPSLETPMEPFVFNDRLATAVPFVTSFSNEGVVTHSVRYVTDVTGPEVPKIFGQPLNAGDSEGVYLGIKQLSYPDSRLSVRARRLGKSVTELLPGIRRDLIGLRSVIERDVTHETVAAKVHVYDQVLADLWARDEMTSMKPGPLINLCDTLGIELHDVVGLWRLKGGKSGKIQIHEEDLYDRGVDTSKLKKQIKQQEFAEKLVADQYRFEKVLVPREDLPHDLQQDMEFMELIRLLPGIKKDGLAERWLVHLRKNGTPLHVAQPVIRWQEDAEGNKTLVTKGAETWFNPNARRVIHMSPLLGAAMLAHTVEDETFTKLTRRMYSDIVYSNRQQEGLPQSAQGSLPALLGHAAVTEQIFESEQFQALERATKL